MILHKDLEEIQKKKTKNTNNDTNKRRITYNHCDFIDDYELEREEVLSQNTLEARERDSELLRIAYGRIYNSDTPRVLSPITVSTTIERSSSTIRSQRSRANMNEEQRNAQRMRDAQRKRSYRDNLSQEELSQINLQRRESNRILIIK